MKSRLWLLRNRLRMSFWVLPTGMGLMAILLSFGMMALDHAVDFDTSARFAWAFTSSGDGARAVLSTVAGSMITVAGVVLSTMVVVLTLASQQFGPRLVRNFIKDYPSQFVIGAFTGCFLYSFPTAALLRPKGHRRRLSNAPRLNHTRDP